MSIATRSRSSTTCIAANGNERCPSTFLTRHCVVMAWFTLEPIDAIACCVFFHVSKRVNWIQGCTAQQNGTKDAFTESRERPEMEVAFEKTLDPIESP